MESNRYNNLVEATGGLTTRGFTAQFEVNGDNQLTITSHDQSYTAKELKIVEYHRFEGATNPSDMAVIYALEAKDGTKGTIIDAYGSEASQRLADVIKEIPVAEEQA